MPSFQYGPCGDGAMRQSGLPSSSTVLLPSLFGATMSAVKAVYQKICWATLPWRQRRQRLVEVVVGRARRRVLAQPLVPLARWRRPTAGPLVSPPRDDRRAGRVAGALLHADAPLVDRAAVRQALRARAGHREPGVGHAPAEVGRALAVVHVAVDPDAVDLLHVVGEELGDVLVGRPVDRHAEVVAVLVLELAPSGPGGRTSPCGTSRGWRTAGRAAARACRPGRW